MKINNQNKNGKEVSIIYGEDNSISVNIFNNKILMEIVGSFDGNLKELEKVIKNYFDENVNVFVHTSYTKWDDISQAIIIDKLRNEICDDGIRNIHRYYESKYSDLDLPLVSGGEKLYTELTGFDFKSKTGLI